MSAPALAPDARLPRRDTLLDAPVMTERLSRLLGADGPVAIDRYDRGRVKYKLGDSLRVLHEVEIDGTPRLVASRTFAGDRSASVYERATRAVAGDGPLRAVAHDPELGTVFWTFPNDRKIAGLAALGADTGAVSRLLGRPVARTELAAYAPEKSATAACLGAGGRVLAYVKVYASADEAAHARRVHRSLPARLDGAEPLRLPAAIAYDAAGPMLAVEALHGRRIDGLRGDELTGAMRRFGAALAALHALPAPHGLPAFTRLDADRQPFAAGVVARARPDVAALALRLAADLAAGRPDDAGAPVPLHGDVHLKNGLLLPDGRIGLIDLDQCGAGPAAADLGSLLAGLRYRALVGGDPAAAGDLEHALLEGYAERRVLPAPAVLGWHVAAALLSERALRAVNRIRPEGLEHLAAVLRAARASLTGAEA